MPVSDFCSVSSTVYWKVGYVEVDEEPWNAWTGDALSAFGHMEPFTGDTDYSSSAYPYSRYYAGAVWLATTSTMAMLDEVIGYSLDESRFTDQSPGTFRFFERVVARAVQEATPLTLFSSQDAIDTHFATFESNHIEALAELGEILQPVDILRLMRALPSHIGKGKTVVILKILDILTDAVLSYNLGIAPTMSDARDIADNSKAFREQVLSGRAFGANTLHGKYSMEVPSELIGGMSGAHVVVRSTVRMKPMADSLLPALLPVRSLGLLPSLSTLWDLFPGSFILDWFTDTGTTLEIVDLTVLMLAMEVEYCVHSITVYSPFSDYQKARMGLTDLSETPSGYKVFMRYVTRNLPVFGPTAYPVVSPQLGNYSTVGAIAYKLLT
jgi:hypothetical protein